MSLGWRIREAVFCSSGSRQPTTRRIRPTESKKCAPFPERSLTNSNIDQIIEQWTWPNFRDRSILLFYRHPIRRRTGIAVSKCARCPPEDFPILVARTVLDDGRRTEIVFGYCERKHAKVPHNSLAKIHSLIHDGQRLSSDFRDGMESIRALVEQMRDRLPVGGSDLQVAKSSRQPRDADIGARVRSAIEAAGLATVPAFVLVAFPEAKITVEALFESRNAPLVQILQNPPEIRNSGFDITVDHTSHIVNGTLRRSVVQESKLLEMHKDGLVIFVNRGDQDGLCWGDPLNSNRRTSLTSSF